MALVVDEEPVGAFASHGPDSTVRRSRSPADPVPAEFKRLAETVNATLDRLEGAYQKLRRFTLDASHDLRSPIAAMRIQVEEALIHPDDTDCPQTVGDGAALASSLITGHPP